MNPLLLAGYHALPTAARSALASMHGFRLRELRYGAETEGLVAEALERDTWTPARWAGYREERLGRLLERAATRVPYYRDMWAARRRRGDRASPEVLEHWPLLSKRDVRAAPRAFIADDRDIRGMHHEHTSGTSGSPLDLWWSRETVRAWYALFEARCRRWHGVTRRDRWAILGGQPVVPGRRRDPPFGVWNAGLSQLYLSAYHLAPGTVAWYAGELERRQIAYLVGYPSALDALARMSLDAGCALPRMSVAVTNAEPLLDAQRARIERAFGCAARESYGMAEIAAAASECAAGRMHLWPDVGVVELHDAGNSVVEGQGGDLVCTGLLNLDMPLVRYRVGDRAVPGGAGCVCGRTLPILSSVDGRADDVLQTPDGRLVGRLDPVFKADLRVQEAQVVQDALDLIRVRVVPAAGFGPDDRRAITQGLQLRLGDVRVVFEEVSAISRTANGKLRSVISRLAAEPSHDRH